MLDKNLIKSAVKSAKKKDTFYLNRRGKKWINEKDSQAIMAWEEKMKKMGIKI